MPVDSSRRTAQADVRPDGSDGRDGAPLSTGRGSISALCQIANQSVGLASDLQKRSARGEQPARPSRAELLAGDDELEIAEMSECHEGPVAELVVCSHEDAPCG